MDAPFIDPMNASLREIRMVVERLVQWKGVEPGMIFSATDCGLYSAALGLSGFEGLEAQIPAIEGERMQAAAQAALYPHVTKDGARQMWSAWTEQINRVSRDAATAAGSLFTVDGKAVGVSGFKKWLRKKLGRRAEMS